MGKTLSWDNCSSITEHGEPMGECVVCDNGHQDLPSSGESKVALDATEVPSHGRIVPPYSLYNSWGESFHSENL